MTSAERVEDDAIWRADGERNGWTLPEPAPWWLRLPVVRQVRAVCLTVRVGRHEAFWQGMGQVPGRYDTWVLHAICRGWC